MTRIRNIFIAALFACLATFAQAPVGLISTAQDLTAAKLDAYYAPPAAVAPTVAPSTDYATYSSNDYLKGLNKQFMEMQAVEIPNKNAYGQFEFSAANWERAGKDIQHLPAPPKYIKIDDAKFDQWWTEFCSGIANGKPAAPPAYFIVDVPALPAPQIIASAGPAPAPANPVGASNGAGVYFVVAGDAHKDGDIYTDSTGTYVKHVYITPFGTTQFWFKLQSPVIQ